MCVCEFQVLLGRSDISGWGAFLKVKKMQDLLNRIEIVEKWNYLEFGLALKTNLVPSYRTV